MAGDDMIHAELTRDLGRIDLVARVPAGHRKRPNRERRSMAERRRDLVGHGQGQVVLFLSGAEILER